MEKVAFGRGVEKMAYSNGLLFISDSVCFLLPPFSPLSFSTKGQEWYVLKACENIFLVVLTGIGGR